MKHSTSSQNKNKITKIILPAIFWLAVWAFAAVSVNQSLLIPSPVEVLNKMVSLAGTIGFWKATGSSLIRIICGTICGIVAGSVIAILTNWFEIFELVLAPVIRIMRATPVASFIILVLLWVKTGFVPSVISFMMVLPVVWENVSSGIRSTDPMLLELADAYHFSISTRIQRIYVPSVRPYFLSGVCTAVGLAWKSGVAAEVLCLPKVAIGTQLYYSKIYLETSSLFAWTAVVVVLSMLIERLVRFFLKPAMGGTKDENN